MKHIHDGLEELLENFKLFSNRDREARLVLIQAILKENLHVNVEK